MNVGVLLTVISWLADRFKEKSTHNGLTGLAAVLTYWFSPEMSEQIILTTGAVLSLIQVAHAEHQSKNPKIPDIEVKHGRSG